MLGRGVFARALTDTPDASPEPVRPSASRSGAMSDPRIRHRAGIKLPGTVAPRNEKSPRAVNFLWTACWEFRGRIPSGEVAQGAMAIS